MKQIRFLLFSTFITLIFVSACGGGGATTEYMPARIVASWSGGAADLPNDRTDYKPEHWLGNLCAPNADNVPLTNHTDEFAGLNIINMCDQTNTFYICASKGSSPQAPLQECAEDPYDTPLTQFKIETLTSGLPGDYINADQILSVNIFYCSDLQILTGPPLRCL